MRSDHAWPVCTVTGLTIAFIVTCLWIIVALPTLLHIVLVTSMAGVFGDLLRLFLDEYY